MHHSQQQGRIGTGCDGQPLVGAGGGRGVHGIDDNDLAPLADCVDDAHHVGCCEQRPLGCRWVGTHDDQQISAFDVGYREAPPAAVHQVRRKVLRPLVDGARRVTDRDARHTKQHTGVAAERERVRERVAGVARDRADPVLLDHRGQQLGAAAEGRSPADLLPLPVDLDHRAPNAVGVVVQRA
jgi:hypothetical protein